MKKLKEACGVFGAYNLDGKNISSVIYYGLLALQHRGQESCGIAVSNTKKDIKNILCYKDMGLVSQVFNKERILELNGDLGVGHVRYSTIGESIKENAQPLALKYIKGTLALAHNGNLINTEELKEKLQRNGAIFHTTIDSEIIAYYIAKERVKTKSIEDAVSKVMKIIKGAYSLILVSPKKLIGVRDPHGFKPLCIGKKDNTYILSSETCALDSIDATFIRDVEPGEIVTITSKGILSDKRNCITNNRRGRCIFEYIYFAKEDSYIDSVSVYNARIKSGEFLAEDFPVEADLVIGVPNSGNTAAKGYARIANIPFAEAFVKNSYIGRTFIKPDQNERNIAVKLKLNVLKEVVRDKRIVLIDDSIVRGTTSKEIITLLRDAGAKEVHIRISSPPFMWPCYFGIDVPKREELIAFNYNKKDICKILGADSLEYLRVDRLSELVNNLSICKGCFTGRYPIRIKK
ncbi:MAG: amidophosphoribosyltransferase [Bacilli bacterium]|nr:amidophosphoribosyltransferase [Bacilli bacterium]